MKSARTLLVTGGNGFVGKSLQDLLVAKGADGDWALEALPDGIDIRDSSLASFLPAAPPDAVLHLAAVSHVAQSFEEPDQCFDVNFHGTWNLLRALRSSGFHGRLLYVSSGDCYGAVPEEQLPVGEDRQLHPRNPYAVSKVAAEALCYQWSQTEGLDVVIARPFNHIGPGQDRRFVIPSFCEQIARIERGKVPPVLLTGNLDVTRDFTDVNDVLDGYFALLERGRRGEAYNVASGREYLLRGVLDTLLQMSRVKAEVRAETGRHRASEQRRVVADITKIHRDTGWAPVVPFETSLESVLEYWRRKERDE